MPDIVFDNSYARLPDRAFARVAPSAAIAPKLLHLNEALAGGLGLDLAWLRTADGIETLSGKRLAATSDPIAMAYAGHQFGNFVPQLGDGRAILIGEVIDRDGRRHDIHLKGAGQTPFSRGGDGRAALGPALREYVIAEAMFALGIPTTRALSVCLTGETVRRDEPAPGAVLARVASSHIRVGTFQYFAARQDLEGLRAIADLAIARHYPQAAESAQPYLSLLNSVIGAQASLVAQWMLVGFIHGVMNTDNVSIAGETLDYGPCAFMDSYDPATVFSSIDRQGRYAYANQPGIALWNMTRFAETLLPLIADDEAAAIGAAERSLSQFKMHFEAAYHAGLRRKMGFLSERDDDVALWTDLFALMKASASDFTLTFRRLIDVAVGDSATAARAMFIDPSAFDAWSARYAARLAQEPHDPQVRRTVMQQANPAFIPRNHRVEQALKAAVERNDYVPFETLLTVLARPYDAQPDFEPYAIPPLPEEEVQATFCGT